VSAYEGLRVLKHKDKCFLDEMSSDALVGLPVEVTGMTMESGDKPRTHMAQIMYR
jgi:hypothetical protein